MQLIKLRGIVLRRHNVGEADRLLVVLTDTLGKITIKARGVRKPLSRLAGHLEPLVVSQLEIVQGRSEIPTLTGAETIEHFPLIRTTLSKTTLALHCAEMLERATHEREPLPGIWQLFWDTLTVLEQNQANPHLKAGFAMRLLRALGFQLQLERCARCGGALTAGQLGFSIALGGVTAGECSEQVAPISVADVKYLRAVSSLPLGRISALMVPAIIVGRAESIADEAFTYHTEVNLKSKAFYESVATGHVG